MFHIYSESHSNYTVQEINIIIIILKYIYYLVVKLQYCMADQSKWINCHYFIRLKWGKKNHYRRLFIIIKREQNYVLKTNVPLFIPLFVKRVRKG